MRRVSGWIMASALAAMLAGCVQTGGEIEAPPAPADEAAAQAAARAEQERERARAEAERSAQQKSDAQARADAERAAAAAAARRSAAPRTRGARPGVTEHADYVDVDVFYATNRAPARGFDDVPVDQRFTATVNRELTYGKARVSIPKNHIPGELESPKWYLLEFTEDPARHVVLKAVDRLPRDAFFDGVSSHVRQSAASNAFIFVHGYNVGFRDAARRTAQLAYDLRFDGAPVFYAWPSQAALSGYFTDEGSIAESVPLIERFLAEMADRSGARNLYVMGHSMGTRGVTRAIANLVERRPDLRGRFRGIILAAPDIDATVFREQLAPAMRLASGRVTLYASSEDLALKASRQVNRGPRAGDTSEGVVLVDGIDTIDVSGVDQSVLAHSYFMESDSVMGDIRQMLRANLPAAQRQPLQTVEEPDGVFWRLLPR